MRSVTQHGCRNVSAARTVFDYAGSCFYAESPACATPRRSLQPPCARRSGRGPHRAPGARADLAAGRLERRPRAPYWPRSSRDWGRHAPRLPGRRALVAPGCVPSTGRRRARAVGAAGPECLAGAVPAPPLRPGLEAASRLGRTRVAPGRRPRPPFLAGPSAGEPGLGATPAAGGHRAWPSRPPVSRSLGSRPPPRPRLGAAAPGGCSTDASEARGLHPPQGPPVAEG